MKKKMIVVSRDYYPTSNATTTCIVNLTTELAHTFDVTVFTKYDFFLKPRDKNRSIRLRRPYAKMLFTVKLVLKVFSRIDALTKQVLKYQIFNYLEKYVLLKSKRIDDKFSKHWIENILEFIEESVNISEIHYVLAVGAPFENFFAAEKIKVKYPHIKLILVYFDLFTNNPDIQPTMIEQVSRSETELRWNDLSDYIFTLEIMKEKLKYSNKSVKDKIKIISFPLLLNRMSLIANYAIAKNKIKIVYTGMFYEKIRNPYGSFIFWQEIFKQLPNVIIEIYGSGCENIVQEFKEKYPNNVFSYGHLSKRKVEQAIVQADFLWNLGNTTVHQIPSKIIEYISFGKPIINHFTNINDNTISILEHYPLKLNTQVSQSIDEDSISKSINFMNEFKGKSVSYDYLNLYYNRFKPSVVANVIESELANDEEDSSSS